MKQDFPSCSLSELGWSSDSFSSGMGKGCWSHHILAFRSCSRARTYKSFHDVNAGEGTGEFRLRCAQSHPHSYSTPAGLPSTKGLSVKTRHCPCLTSQKPSSHLLLETFVTVNPVFTLCLPDSDATPWTPHTPSASWECVGLSSGAGRSRLKF